MNENILSELSISKIMDLQLSELDLSITGSSFEVRINRLYDELNQKGLIFKPHVWISDEWFTPDDIPGFGIPFYLLHPKLIKLEKREMFEAEGENESECMKILRHETGHAISHAYKIYNNKEWSKVFGSYRTPYPVCYTPNPGSKNFVVHLNAWYAQAHPVEDFAETFAVWLNPKINWKKRYSGWGALNKLKYVDLYMNQIKKLEALNKSAEEFEPLKDLHYTIREHYQRKKKFYSIEWPEEYDRDLKKIFGSGKDKVNPVKFLRKIRKQLRSNIADVLDIPPYTIDQLILNMMRRSKELNLRSVINESDSEQRLLIILTSQLTNYINSGYYKIPL